MTSVFSWDPTRHTTRTDVKAEVIKICERDGKSESRGQLAEERQKRKVEPSLRQIVTQRRKACQANIVLSALWFFLLEVI